MPEKTDSGRATRIQRLAKWLTGAIGSVIVALVIAWTQHWIGPRPASAIETLHSADLAGKWMLPDQNHYWVILPGAADTFVIEIYAPGADQVGYGEGSIVNNEFQFSVSQSNHYDRNGTAHAVSQEFAGRLQLVDGKLSGPTDRLTFDWLETLVESGEVPDEASMLTLTRP